MPSLHRPGSMDEVCQLLETLDEPLVYGGGTAIQILTKQGVLFATDLVDIAQIPGIAEVEVTPDEVRVGPMTSLRRMETDPAVREVVPLVARTYGRVANPRVRNTASVGGNIAHGDYRLDPPTALLALDATVELTSSSGTRQLPIREFFVDFQQTAIEHGELVSRIRIPVQRARSGCFVKISSLSVNDWPCASAAALVDGAEVSVGLGAVAPTPVHFSVPLRGLSPDEAVDAALATAEPLIDPIEDVRGSVLYKRRLARVAIEEAVRTALEEQADD